MNKIYFNIFLFLISCIVATVSAGPVKDRGTARQLFRLDNPTRQQVNFLERNGGRVERYIPGEFAEVWLPRQLAAKAASMENILMQQIPAENLPALQEDLVIGSGYHSYSSVSAILDSLAQEYADICRKISLGQTVQGREIWALNIGDNPYSEELEPEVRFLANMHGNEAVTQELILFFIDSLLQSYNHNPRIKKLLDETEIWIVPNMNFDGTQSGTRFNAANVDLNRDFPDREFDTISDTWGRQPETVHVMDWSQHHNFVLAANFHSGALVANYPWDKNIGTAGYAATPDDSTFIHLALTYAGANPEMAASRYFDRGITNGALWYDVSGSLQDWNYNWMAAMELTIEVSEVKMPAEEQIRAIWDQNSESMIRYLEQVHTGISGIVRDSLSGRGVAARLSIPQIGKDVWTDADFGDYYRLLRPGIYTLQITAEGYTSKTVHNVRVDSGYVNYVDVLLSPRNNFNFSGTISDSLSGFPLADVRIRAYHNTQLVDSTVSGDDGYFELMLEKGNYKFVFSREGYWKRKFELTLNMDLTRDIRLLPLVPGSLRGQVLLAGGGDATGAVVYCQGKTDTLSRSTYSFEDLLPGKINVAGYKAGYKTTIVDTFLANADSMRLDILLIPGDNALFLDFEDSDGGFLADGDWQFGQATAGPGYIYSGTNLWATRLDSVYSSGAHLSILETPLMSVQGFIKPQLDIMHWFAFEDGYDGGNVVVSTDEGRSWQLLDASPDYPLVALPGQYHNPLAGQPAFSGRSNNWTRVSFDLQKYSHSPLLKFRFVVGVDDQKEDLGWYLDDFHLYDANAVGLARSAGIAAAKSLKLRIYPNPANPAASFEIQPISSDELSLQIFDINGRLVHVRKLIPSADDKIICNWTGSNLSGRMVASGIYFVQIKQGGRYIFRKLTIVR